MQDVWTIEIKECYNENSIQMHGITLCQIIFVMTECDVSWVGGCVEWEKVKLLQ